jgi:putative ABC transport system permease protein
MFIDILTDLFYNLKQQKLRTFLTGFGVGWGIFILILLLGTSGGLEKGILQLLNSFAQNSIWFYGGNSTAEKGNNKFTKPVVFNVETINQLKHNYSGLIDHISPEIQVNANIIYKDLNSNSRVFGVYPDYFQIKILTTEIGRFLTPADNNGNLKVAVIGERVKEQLFGKKPALDKEIQIGNSFFRIVGVLKGGNMFSQAEQNAVFIPFQTAIVCLEVKNEFRVIGLTLKNNTDTKTGETYIKKFLGRYLQIDAEDSNALYVLNFNQQVKSFQTLFKGLNIFLWFIGICLLVSGIVGVTNIMFVIVNERTREIGIRKAVGAQPNHILWMILIESATITVMAGIIGLLMGAGVLAIIKYALKTLVDKDFLIKDISINWGIVVGALFILIFSGIIAGLIPAKRATEIQPIDAIRYE